MTHHRLTLKMGVMILLITIAADKSGRRADGWTKRVLDRLETAGLVVEVSEMQRPG